MRDFLLQYFAELIIFAGLILSLGFSLMKVKMSDLMSFALIIALFLLGTMLFSKRLIRPESFLMKNDLTYYLKLICLSSFICALGVFRKTLSELHIENKEIPVLFFSSLMGCFLLISANDFMTTFLSLELLSLSTYVMCAALAKVKNSAEASMKYMVLGVLATAFFAFGVALIYGGIQTFSFSQMSLILKGKQEISILVRLGCIFVLISLFFKLSVAPFHLWLPDIFQGASLVVVMFISSLPKVAILGLLIRLLYGPFEGLYFDWQGVIMICGLLSVGWGTFAALHQTNLKRLLAYSSISHMGFMIIPLINQNSHGISASIIYMTFYTLIMLAIFSILLWFKRLGFKTQEIKGLAVVNRSHPNMVTILSILFISISGIPPFSGFFVKFYVIESFIENKGSSVSIGVSIYLLIMSVISVYYYLKIIKDIYFQGRVEFKGHVEVIKDHVGFCVMMGLSILSIAIFWIPVVYKLLWMMVSKAVSALPVV